MNRYTRLGLIALLVAVGAGQAFAQTAAPAAPAPATTAPAAAPAAPADPDSVPDVDLTKLNPEQKKLVLKILREEKCNCPCGMTLYDCRHKDSKCPNSPGLCKQVVDAVLAGKKEADIRDDFQPKLLDKTAQAIDYTGMPSKGPADAKIVLAEYSDFQCPFCAQSTAWAEDVLKAFPKDVRLVFKQFPLPMHPHANIAAQAALAAHAQGKFWPMHDKMFENFKTINPDNLKEWAKGIAGLDVATFTKALDEGKYKAAVDKDYKEGEKIGVQGTPTFFLNGKKIQGRPTMEQLKPVIEAELKGTGAPKAADTKPAAATKPDAKPKVEKAKTK